MPSTPNILWNPPALLLVGMLVDSALNAVAQDGAGNPVAGTWLYEMSVVSGQWSVVTIGTTVPAPDPNGNGLGPIVFRATFTPSDLTAFTVATATVSIGIDMAYLVPATVRAMAAPLTWMPGIAGVLAQSDVVLTGLALEASRDIDVANRYQGQKYNEDIKVQPRQFPRVPFGPPRPFPAAASYVPVGPYPLVPGVIIWDWDRTANGGNGAAVVPTNVQLATLYQMAWLMQPKYAKRIEAIRSGLTGVRTGSAEENYRAGASNAGEIGHDGLGARAAAIMKQYLLTTGRDL